VGLNPWLDKKNIRGGEDWRLAIEPGLKNSRFFIPLLSTSLLKRRFVHREFRNLCCPESDTLLEDDCSWFCLGVMIMLLWYDMCAKPLYVNTITANIATIAANIPLLFI
jgi:TIR domain